MTASERLTSTHFIKNSRTVQIKSLNSQYEDIPFNTLFRVTSYHMFRTSRPAHADTGCDVESTISNVQNIINEQASFAHAADIDGDGDIDVLGA